MLLLLGLVGGVVIGAVRGKAVRFEAQDVVMLLVKAVGNDGLSSKDRVQFVDGVGLVWEGKELMGNLKGRPLEVKQVQNGEEGALGNNEGK